jgi:hypothetical protein
MKILKLSILFLASVSVASISISAQSGPLLKRTTYKTDRLPFGPGGTLAIVGAPNGSIRVEGWSKNEVEVVAEIEIQADTEDGLTNLSAVTGFVLEESLGRTGIISIGTHDKRHMKKAGKKFPKTLLSMPFRIDYVVKVPRYTDLQIDGGKGELSVSAVDGSMRINYLVTDAKIDLAGGAITATFGSGNIDITIPTRSWRGRFAEVSLASGVLNLGLPVGLNAEFDASILRTGKIENLFSGFTPRDRKGEFTEKSIIAKSGSGSIPLRFTVGDGTMTISEIKRPG